VPPNTPCVALTAPLTRTDGLGHHGYPLKCLEGLQAVSG